MLQNNIRTLIYSMITAILTGICLSFIAIFFYNYFTVPYKYNIDYEKNISLKNEDIESNADYFSHLSNSFIYSAKNDFEIYPKDSAYPKESKKNISASSYLVLNISDGQKILEKNSEKLMSIASITKLVTAVIALNLLNRNEYISISSRALNTYGNEAKLRNGEKFMTEELLYPLLMVSSNDAAEALAMSYSGGRAKFIKEMNNWANSIGAYRTYFRDPSGLSSQNVSTVNDISIITEWILENYPEIFEITNTKYKILRTHTWINPTRFLNLNAYFGGKNGYTPEANKTGLALFKLGKEKKIFAVILLNSLVRDNDTLDLLDEAVM